MGLCASSSRICCKKPKLQNTKSISNEDDSCSCDTLDDEVFSVVDSKLKINDDVYDSTECILFNKQINYTIDSLLPTVRSVIMKK